MAVVATAVSFLVIIIAVTVASGFRHEIREGISSMSGDVCLTGEPLEITDGLMDDILGTEGVTAATPVIMRAGIVKKGTDIQGAMVKGVPGRDSSLSVSIPAGLARELRLGIGDPMTTYFVDEKMKVRKFTVESIYESPVETEESLIVFAPIEDMRRLNGWEDDEVSAIELRVEGNDREGLRRLAYMLGDRHSVNAYSVRDRYSQLFDWLDLLDFNVIALLVLMTAVAGFNMISGLYIFLFRNVSTIGMLKSMGMTDRSVSKVFLLVAARTVAEGMAIGNAVAMVFCLIQGSTHLIRLNPENYFLSFVPVRVNVPFILTADAAAFLAIMLILLIPTVFIAKVDPAQTVKAE